MAAAGVGLVRAMGPPSRHLTVTNAEQAGSEMEVRTHTLARTHTYFPHTPVHMACFSLSVGHVRTQTQ